MKEEVRVDFNLYHKKMNELECLRSLAIRLFYNEIDIKQFNEAISENNKIYKWWI